MVRESGEREWGVVSVCVYESVDYEFPCKRGVSGVRVSV